MHESYAGRKLMILITDESDDASRTGYEKIAFLLFDPCTVG
jgi:hypothetical protein